MSTSIRDIMIENKLFEHDLVYRQRKILMARPSRSKRVLKFMDLLDATTDQDSVLFDVWKRYKELGAFVSLEAIADDEDEDEEDDMEDEPNEYDLNDDFINDEVIIDNPSKKRRKILLDIERKKQELKDLERELQLN